MNAFFRVSISRLLAVLLAFGLVAAACGSSGSDSAPETVPEETVAEDTSDDTDESVTTGTAAPESAIPDNPLIGAALSQFSDPENDNGVGQIAPNLDAVSLKGDRIQIDQADGRGKIYGFFAHWCPHCQAEVPVLVDYLETNRLPVNVDFHAVSTAVDSSRDNHPPIDWFDTENWPFPVLDDSQLSAIASGFGLPAFPYFVVVGGDGAVVQRIAGSLSNEEAISEIIALAEASAN